MTTYSICAFCGRNDSPRTREHVFADWIAREFPDPQWSRIEPSTGKIVPFKNSLGLVCKKVCERCNTGWMRGLESEAKPVLIPLIHATKRGSLSHNEQLIIARWFMKTVFAFDIVATRTRDPVFTADERKAMATSLTIPTDTSIFIAQYRGTMGAVVTLETHMAPTVDVLPEKHHNLLDNRGYAGTVVIKHLALQIFIFRRSKNLIGKTVGFGLPVEWDKAALQLCFRGQSINWPPQTLLEDDGLKAFASRWVDMSLVIK